MKKRFYLWERALSVILIAAMLWTTLSTDALTWADTGAAGSAQEETTETIPRETPAGQEEIKSEAGVYEVTELREEKVKHFHLEDGTYVAVLYEEPVHVRDADGKWQDIDNKITESGSELSAQNARIKFAKKITGNSEIFTLHAGNYKMTLSLKDAIKKTSAEVENPREEYESLSGEERFAYLAGRKHLISKVFYADILNGVDLEYVIQGESIKENIYVKEAKDEYSYTFQLKLNNLEAELCEDGSVRVFDPENGENVYRMPNGYMYDANGIYSYDVTYTLEEQEKNRYNLILTADAEWMNAPERAFPVCIDPAVVPERQDNYETASIEYYDAYGGSTTELWTGNTAYVYYKIKTLPSLPSDAVVTKGSLLVTGQQWRETSETEISELALGTFPVESDWDAERFCYRATEDGEGTLGSHAYDICTVTNAQDGAWEYRWDITQHLREWYENPDENYGLAITVAKNWQDALYPQFRFTLGSNSAPAVQIFYRRISGLEEYWSYTTQEAGVAGTGYINNATGRLTFVLGALNGLENLIGHSTALIYDQSCAGKYFLSDNTDTPNVYPVAGYGMKLNIHEYLLGDTFIDAEGQEKTYYIWMDADGTPHDFYPVEGEEYLYTDADGLLLMLLEQVGQCLMYDLNGNAKIFKPVASPGNTGYLLAEVQDANGNRLVYNNTYGGLTSGVALIPKSNDQVISSIAYETYTYNSHGLIKSVQAVNSATAPQVHFYYSPKYYKTTDISQDYSGYLKKVEYRNNGEIVAAASYEYDSKGRLAAVCDETSGYRVEYGYLNEKVYLVTEYDRNGEIGQRISIAYNNGCTTIHTGGTDDVYATDDDILTNYMYDANGRVVSSYSTDLYKTVIYSASSNTYETQENRKNSIEATGSLKGSTAVYLFNGGFELRQSRTEILGWMSTAGITFEEAKETGYAPYGNYLARIPAGAGADHKLTQYVFLPEGTYTLSLDAYTYAARDAEVSISAVSQNVRENETHRKISVNRDDAEEAFVNYSVEFTVSDYNGTGGEEVCIEITVKNTAASTGNDAYVLVDNVMLEEGKGQSGYSMVQLGNFEDFHRTDLDRSYRDYDYDEAWDTNGSAIRYDSLFGRVLKLAPTYSVKECYARQSIYTAAGEEQIAVRQVFVVSGMARGTYQVASGTFGIFVTVVYADGEQEVYDFPFVNDINDWQFVSGTVVTKAKTIQNIRVEVRYANNPGIGYFDNIYVTQVLNDSHVTMQYYQNGRTQVVQTGTYEEVYEYDEAYRLVRVANNKGQLYDYTYEQNSYNVSKVTYSTFYSNAGTGLGYPYMYGNPEGLINVTNKSRTEYTYSKQGLLTEERMYTADGTSPYGKKRYTYDGPGINYGALSTETDMLGNVTKYFYDPETGQLRASINLSTKTGTCYTYDRMGNLESVMPATYVQGGSYSAVTGRTVTYGYNEGNLLESITTATSTYTFRYDTFGKTTDISVGGNEIVGYEYNDRNGKLNTIRYANGYAVSYVYDTFDNISEVWYSNGSTDTLAYVYRYNADGRLAEVENKRNQTNTVYSYDGNGRLTGYVEYNKTTAVNTLGVSLSYDEASRVSRLRYGFDYRINTSGETNMAGYEVVYGADYNRTGTLSRWTIETPNLSAAIQNVYDSYDRLQTKVCTYTPSAIGVTYSNVNTYAYATQGNYDGDGGNSTLLTGLIRNHTSIVGNVTYLRNTYTYDNNAYITKILDKTNQSVRYVYDDYGQLIREDNPYFNRTYIYRYDGAGNILAKYEFALTAEGSTPTTPIDSVMYGYGDASWKDKLTYFDGQNITYDAIGNPLSYYNGKRWSLGWRNGRELAVIAGNGSTLTFTYNDEGIRTTKTVNGVKHTYTVSGGQILTEEWGEHFFVYLYDENGNPVGMQYRHISYAKGRFDTYYFIRNLQGDITHVLGENKTLLASYSYDAWGNVKTTYSNGGASTAAAYNPFLYRGYYYDFETGLYYLQSRYYDPAVGRFISPDSIYYLGVDGGILSYNLYAYCENNPVNRYDLSGHFWDYIFDAIFIAWGVFDLINGGYKDWKSWFALGVDVVFAVIPFVTSGEGQIIKVGNKIDNVFEVADSINKIENIQEISKVTMIGRNMERVVNTATLIGKADNLYKAWKGYDTMATGAKRFVHNSILMIDDAWWMFGKLRSGYTVIDIGVKTTHRGKGLYYGAERLVIGLWKTRNFWKLPINFYF